MFKIIAPASTANLGPAFDTAGCALNLSLELSVKIIDGEAHGSRVKMELVDSNGASINDPDVPLDHRNLILKSAYYFQQRITHGKSPQQSAKECAELSGIEGLFHGVSSDKCVQIKCMNRIPLSRGLGSSASAIVSAALLVNTLNGWNMSKDQLLPYILELENHPDNVGACLFGGMFVGYTTSSGYCGHASIKWPKSIKMICVIPTELRLSTELARNVLPVSYSRADVVSNIQRLAVLVATLASINAGGPIDRKLIHESLSDCIHQPYRMSLVPGLEHMVRDLMPETTPGLLGIVLSGAGPTVLALATENFDNIGELMVKIFQDNGVKAKYLLLEVEDGGAKIETSE